MVYVSQSKLVRSLQRPPQIAYGHFINESVSCNIKLHKIVRLKSQRRDPGNEIAFTAVIFLLSGLKRLCCPLSSFKSELNKQRSLFEFHYFASSLRGQSEELKKATETGTEHFAFQDSVLSQIFKLSVRTSGKINVVA